QRAKVQPPVPLGKPASERPQRAEASAGRQQATEHGLRPQRILWTVVELQHPGLGSTLLRELAGVPQVATPAALREVRRHGGRSLGWHRVVLPCRQQGGVGLCRGPQQQDPHHPKESLRLPRRRVSPAKDPHLHAAKTLKNYPHYSAMSLNNYGPGRRVVLSQAVSGGGAPRFGARYGGSG